jgi:hypothetical protein
MILADYRLPRRVRRAFTRLAPAICPPDVETLGLVEAVVDHVELTLRSFPAVVRHGIAAGAVTIDVTSRLLREDPGRTFDRFFSLPGPPHALAKGIKAALAMAYFEHPLVRRALGYDQASWIAEVGKRRLERFAEAIRRAEADVVAPNPLLQIGRKDRKVDDEAA